MIMDEAVIKYYRRMLRDGFDHAGSLENPSIFLDTQGKNISLCGQAAGNSMQLYIGIRDGVIEEIKYLCTCDPMANVVIEVLCGLIKGRTLAYAKGLVAEDLSQVIGSVDKTFRERAGKALEFLGQGIARYESEASHPSGHQE